MGVESSRIYKAIIKRSALPFRMNTLAAVRKMKTGVYYNTGYRYSVHPVIHSPNIHRASII